MRLLPYRDTIKFGILSLANSVLGGIANIVIRLEEWAQQFLYPNGNRRAVLPTTNSANRENAITRALLTKSEELEAVHHDDRRDDVDHDTMVVRAEEKEDATHFWKRPSIAEGLPLIVTKTQAHLRAIQ